MYSIYFKTTERSDSTIRHYSLFISHSLKFHKSGGRWPRASSLIGKETIKKRISNIEQGIMNVEVGYSIDFIY